MPPPISLEQWMEDALYHPGRGYYTRHIKTVGRGGDFSTTATLTSVLGRAIARWVAGEARHHGNSIRHVIEVGAGDGSLMRSVLRHRPLRARLSGVPRYHIVEASPVLEARQRALLGGRVSWHPDLPAALDAANGAALVYSNELVDAFPVTQLRWSGEGWEEVWIDPSSQPPQETFRPFASPPGVPLSALDISTWPSPPRVGHRLELHLSYQRWLAGWLPLFKQGSLLTIDYGGPSPALPSGRPAGSLRAYLKHQRLTGADVFLNPGRQDITADVNFTDLQAWGEGGGLAHVGLQTQRDFLLQRLPRLAASRDPAVQMALDPEGAGSAFHVLHQRR